MRYASLTRLEMKLMSKAIQLLFVDSNIISQQQLGTARRYVKSKCCY